MAKKRPNNYGDGIAEVYRKKDIEKNVRSLEDLKYLGFLYFSEKSKRQQDIEFAQQQGANLTLKISTGDDAEINSNENIVIGDVIYAIIYIDHNRASRELYIYLEEVRRVER